MDTEGQFHEQTALNNFEIDLDEIFWSSDEDMFISSHNTEIITIASDSDNYEFQVTIIEEIEDNKNWGEDELEGEDDKEKDNQKSLLLQFKICKYCKNILTNFNLPQCNTCWLEKRSGMSKPSNKKQKRKNCYPRIQKQNSYLVPIFRQIFVNYAAAIKRTEDLCTTHLVIFCVAINVVKLYLNNKAGVLTAAGL